MLVIEMSGFGGPEVLRVAERPRPEPSPGTVLIRMEAAGVARADLLQRQGKYPPPPGASDLLGLDVAGVVEQVGQGVTKWQIGDQVCAILSGGGYAEFCVVPSEQVLPIPTNWTFSEAATLPENAFTAFDNLVTRAGLVAGETVLVHGGASGLGSMAIMLARALGAIPLATARSEEKCAACLSFGAAQAFNYTTQDFAVQSLAATGGRGVDVIFDMVGGPYLKHDLECLAVEGRIVFVATQKGRTGELDIGTLISKRARVLGSTMRARTPPQKGAVAEKLRAAIWPMLPSKNPIRPAIDSAFSLTDAALAHQRLESGEHIGRVILTRPPLP